MRKLITWVLACAFLCIVLVGCSSKYNEADFLGKTSEEILAEYGPFDCVTMPVSEDGLYRNCRCGYTIKEPQRGFWGTSEEILFYIVFDENGIAKSCEEGYRPGG